MQVTIVTATAFDPANGSYGWAAAGQSFRGTFRVGGRLDVSSTDEVEAQVAAAMNAIQHAIDAGDVQDGDDLIVGVEGIAAAALLVTANKSGTYETAMTALLTESLADWRHDLDLAFEFRCTAPGHRFGEQWQRNASVIMAQAAATDPHAEALVPLAMR